jgi:hypothetical protein
VYRRLPANRIGAQTGELTLQVPDELTALGFRQGHRYDVLAARAEEALRLLRRRSSILLRKGIAARAARRVAGVPKDAFGVEDVVHVQNIGCSVFPGIGYGSVAFRGGMMPAWRSNISWYVGISSLGLWSGLGMSRPLKNRFDSS